MYFVTIVCSFQQTLQKEAINIAYEGHHDMAKTKTLVREQIRFLGIDKMVEQCVSSCIACQASVLESKWEPLETTHLTKVRRKNTILQ